MWLLFTLACANDFYTRRFLSGADGFGTTLAPAGDVDGDGTGDLLIRDVDGTHLFLGQDLVDGTLDPVTVLPLDDALAGSLDVACSPVSLGDLDGDGGAEVLDCAFCPEDALTCDPSTGVLALWSSGTLMANSAPTLDQAELVLDVSADQLDLDVGDLEGDGVLDVAIATGRTGVYVLRTDTLPAGRAELADVAQLAVANLGDRFGHDCDRVAWYDPTGNGADSLVVASPDGLDPDETEGDNDSTGRVWIWSSATLSVATGTVDLADATRILSGAGSSAWALDVMSGGDLDGDTKEELVIVGRFDRFSVFEDGGIWIMPGWRTDFGRAQVAPVGDAFLVYPDQLEMRVGAFGPGAATSSDVDGDGFPDLIMHSAPQRTVAIVGRRVGRLLVMSGDEAGGIWEVDRTDDRQGSGLPVCSLGDADGDGLADLAMGLPARDRVRVYLSGP